MTTPSSTPTTRRRSVTSMVAAIGAAAAAAAVAGMATYGHFTDSTSPVDTLVDTGELGFQFTGIQKTGSAR